MKTTVDIPEALLRHAKAQAAKDGTSMRELFVAAIEDRLSAGRAVRQKRSGWRSVFGKASPKAVAEIACVIEAEFETINPDDWS